MTVTTSNMTFQQPRKQKKQSPKKHLTAAAGPVGWNFHLPKGLFRSENGFLLWELLFSHLPVPSIGGLDVRKNLRRDESGKLGINHTDPEKIGWALSIAKMDGFKIKRK